MIEKRDLEMVFQAWYDHKMAPDEPELRSTLEDLKDKMEELLGYPTTVGAVRQSIGQRFGTWMTENGLPKPPK
jgi:hypothetical protein